jgi:hypothetical protein
LSGVGVQNARVRVGGATIAVRVIVN